MMLSRVLEDNAHGRHELLTVNAVRCEATKTGWKEPRKGGKDAVRKGYGRT